MATTTNYGWTTPDDTALVKDGAAAIRTLGSSVDTTTKALNPSTTLGDIEYRSSTANTNTRLAIGSSGQVLSVSAGVPAWTTPAATTPTFVGCQASNTGATVSIANNTQTKIALNTEIFDTDGFHDNTTNNTRLTVPTGKGGYYLVSGFSGFWGAAGGERTAYIFKNNAEIKAIWTAPSSTVDCGMHVAAVVSLAAGDYVEFALKQNSGSSLQSSWASGSYGWFELSYLGA
jgi:hypothetical protein